VKRQSESNSIQLLSYPVFFLWKNYENIKKEGKYKMNRMLLKKGLFFLLIVALLSLGMAGCDDLDWTLDTYGSDFS
jgi:hypothetical protein